MALTTRYAGEIVLTDNSANLVFGTVMLGTAFGQVESASVSREADMEKLKAAGGKLLAVILSDPMFSFTVKTVFASNVTPPGIGDLIVFPLAGISGRVLPPVTIDWEKQGHRMLSIKAESWDAFSGVNSGGGNAYRYEGGTFTLIT